MYRVLTLFHQPIKFDEINSGSVQNDWKSVNKQRSNWNRSVVVILGPAKKYRDLC